MKHEASKNGIHRYNQTDGNSASETLLSTPKPWVHGKVGKGGLLKDDSNEKPGEGRLAVALFAPSKCRLLTASHRSNVA